MSELISESTNWYYDDLTLIRLAREIAMDHYELDTILERYGIEPAAWERIKTDKYFTTMLQSEIVAWGEAANTHERTKLKAAALVEEWLPEANDMLRARGESLAARVQLASLLTKVAGMGLADAVVSGAGGERFVVNINLGEKHDVKIDKVIDSPIIEEEPVVLRNRVSTNGGGGVAVSDPLASVNESMKKW